VGKVSQPRSFDRIPSCRVCIGYLEDGMMPKKPKFDLAELVARIPKGYRPHEESWGPPVGKEEW